MGRSMSVCSLNEDGFTADYTEQDESGSRLSAQVGEDESMHDQCRHTDNNHNDMHIHTNVCVKEHHAECPPSTAHMHMNMDVIDHNADCSPPPPLDSSDTNFASQYPLDFLPFLQGSDPVKEELDRLQNEVREKNRELIEVRTEMKALKIAERSREKALEELADELDRVDERLERAELILENKNLELKRMSEEKKAAQVAQHAAEAIVRRVQATHMRDEELPPIEAILAPLDSELKLTRQEVARLQEENRVLDRLIKSKEAALLEAERTVQIATAKASMVDDLQNKNQELAKHIEFCQEENKVLDKLYRQKITEVEMLSTRVGELGEMLLSSGPNEVNAARDYQRQLQQLQEEKKALERELARAKIVANRVSVVIANGWKGSNDKVMPVKHWLEERRLLQSEMEQLRQKLASMERAAKAESILKEKVQIRLKVLEESVMFSAHLRNLSQARSPRCAIGAAASAPTRHVTPIIAPQIESKSINSSSRSSTRPSALSGIRNSAVNERASRASEQDSSRILLGRRKPICKSFNSPSIPDFDVEMDSVNQDINTTDSTSVMTSMSHVKEMMADCEHMDLVSGKLYDLLQKEVVILRKTCQQKDHGLVEKDNTIEMLEKKVSSLNHKLETESKKVRREVAALEKEVATLRSSAVAPSPPPPLHKHKKNPQT